MPLFVRIAEKDSCLMRSSHVQNDVEHFRNVPVYEAYSLKASQMCKAHTSSHEITSESYVVQTTKLQAKP